jgi:hypothetical protein
MLWLLARHFNPTLQGHCGRLLLTLLMLHMRDRRRNGSTHGIHQWIRKGVPLALAHDLIVQFQSRKENPEGTRGSGGDGNILPALMLWEKLALQLLDQLVIKGASYQLRGCIPVCP